LDVKELKKPFRLQFVSTMACGNATVRWQPTSELINALDRTDELPYQT
jgi:hypothetical protein